MPAESAADAGVRAGLPSFRIIALDYLRTLGVLLVVLYHTLLCYHLRHYERSSDWPCGNSSFQRTDQKEKEEGKTESALDSGRPFCNTSTREMNGSSSGYDRVLFPSSASETSGPSRDSGREGDLVFDGLLA